MISFAAKNLKKTQNIICVFFFVQHEDAASSGSSGRHEQGYLEEERVRVLARIDELKNRLMELEQQLQESKQEVQQAQEVVSPPNSVPVTLQKKQTAAAENLQLSFRSS